MAANVLDDAKTKLDALSVDQRQQFAQYAIDNVPTDHKQKLAQYAVDNLPDGQKQAVAEYAVQALGKPSTAVVDYLWRLVVWTFAILLVGGAAAVVAMTVFGRDPKDLLPLVTAALGVLAGLLAPSPVANK